MVARGWPPADGRCRAGFGAGRSGKSGIQPGRLTAALLPDFGVLWVRFTHCVPAISAPSVADLGPHCKSGLTIPDTLSIVRALRQAQPRTPARVAELVDALASGVSDASRGGSSPLPGTTFPLVTSPSGSPWQSAVI